MFCGEKFEMSNSADIARELKTMHIDAPGFQFVQDQYGFRKGKLHLHVSNTGKGKSTLARSLMVKVAKDHKVLLWGTEESKEDLQAMLALRGHTTEDLKNLSFQHERFLFGDAGLVPISKWKQQLEVSILNSGCEMFFFDNLTASRCYKNLKPNEQDNFSDALKDVLEKTNIPAYVVMHGSKQIRNDTLFTPEDIKGATGIGIIAEYAYAQHTFAVPTRGMSDSVHSFLRIMKSRFTGEPDSVYSLAYDWEKKMYTGATKTTWSDFIEIFKQSAKLKR